jgi:hypothetical protein
MFWKEKNVPFVEKLAFQIPLEHAFLWQQLENFVFDKPGADVPFSRRLAKENRWSHGFALQVIEEYRKFLYLMKTQGHVCTPSRLVDQAWHLHLLYTTSYWDDLCRDIFHCPMHHHPGDGSTKDTLKYAAIYERTLEDYQRVFGEPPRKIWGRRNLDFDWCKLLAELEATGSITNPFPNSHRRNFMLKLTYKLGWAIVCSVLACGLVLAAVTAFFQEGTVPTHTVYMAAVFLGGVLGGVITLVVLMAQSLGFWPGTSIKPFFSAGIVFGLLLGLSVSGLGFLPAMLLGVLVSLATASGAWIGLRIAQATSSRAAAA